MNGWRKALATAALATAGCAGDRLPVAGKDAPARHVLRASQYAITTDFELDPNDPVVWDLTTLRDRVQQTLKLRTGREPIRVIIFDSQQRYAEFLTRNYPELPNRRAFFVQQGPGESVVFTFRGARLREDLRHEATHALLHTALPNVPLWLDEGLAEYFEADPDRNGLRSGYLDRLQRQFDSGSGPDLPRLERLTDVAQTTAADYRESWLWVHFCLHGPPVARSAFQDHLTALAGSPSDSLHQRLSAAIPDLPAAVVRHLHDLTAANPTEPTTPVDASEAPIQPEPSGNRHPFWKRHNR